MNTDRSLHCWFEYLPLEDDKGQIGVILNEYEVREFKDVRNLGHARSYVVEATQRLMVPNAATAFDPKSTSGFHNYPICLNASVNATFSGSPASYLESYSPRTINSSVSTSQSSGGTTSSANTITNQYSSGSSTTDTNSFGVGISLGTFGDSPTDSLSFNAEYSEAHSSSASASNGRSTSSDAQASDSRSAAMSIKDWGAYAYCDSNARTVSWLWGQEYPWNILTYHTPINDVMSLPDHVLVRMFPPMVQSSINPKSPEIQLVLPPSQLSLFGIDFVSKARWIVSYSATDAATRDLATFSHTVTYYAGSHYLNGDNPPVPQVELKPVRTFNLASPSLDLGELSLDAILKEGATNGAAIGFVPSQFISPPAGASIFRIRSGANNLLVTGTGFAAASGADAPMEADFSIPVSFNIVFKVTDPLMQLQLVLKHWKTGAVNCTLSISINGSAPIVRHVDAQEAGGGSDNVTAVILRSLNYHSVEVYDYLVLGINRIDVTVTAEQIGKASGYALRAIAIG